MQLPPSFLLIRLVRHASGWPLRAAFRARTRLLPSLLAMVLVVTAAPAHADILLLLSNERPSVSQVAQAIEATTTDATQRFTLDDDPTRDSEILRELADSPNRQVIAIGLKAARLARENLQGKQVVFCQVLNFEEFDLITPWMKGVSAIPSLSRQFAAWKLLDPNLRRIGIMTGRQTRYMISEATAAAKRLGLELVHAEASSERAVLFAAQELHQKGIQGLWLAPDSSILSQRAVQELMTYSARNNLQVLAFSPALLNEGALLSAASDPEEIARLVLARLKKPADGDTVAPLNTARITVNRVAAERFGLQIRAKLLEQVDAR